MERSVAVEPAERLNVLNDNMHSTHCRACKDRVGEMLKNLYHDCRINYQFPWSSRPENYTTTPIGDLLRQIRTDLGNLRGHRDFIRSLLIPPCDFHVIDPPFILEFDESQHFTQPRLLCLSRYTKEIATGFSVPRWQELCREINAVDDIPIDRDERRAWYDTLRDLVPTLHGFAPTVRLYAEEFTWCSLDLSSDQSLKAFSSLLHDRLPATKTKNNR